MAQNTRNSASPAEDPVVEPSADNAPANKGASPSALDMTTDEKADDNDTSVVGKTRDRPVGAESGEKGDHNKESDDKPIADTRSSKKEVAETTTPVNPTTPAAKKKSVPKPSRKKSLGSTKKSTPAKTTSVKFEPGNYVIAKMRSYPPWPAIVLSKELLPEVMKKGKPKSLETLGPSAWNTQYPILFMGTYE
jgi:hypothetical protein